MTDCKEQLRSYRKQVVWYRPVTVFGLEQKRKRLEEKQSIFRHQNFVIGERLLTLAHDFMFLIKDTRSLPKCNLPTKIRFFRCLWWIFLNLQDVWLEEDILIKYLLVCSIKPSFWH